MISKDDSKPGKHDDPSDDAEEIQDPEQQEQSLTENEHESEEILADDTSAGVHLPHQAWLSRIVVIIVHFAFMAVAVLLESAFVYTWSDESDVVAWMSATNQSVVQHLKMMLWPWLLILFPMDVTTRRFWYGRTTTFYLKQISKSSWLTLCMAELLGMLTAMMIIAVFFAIFFYAGNEELVVDVILFLVAVVIGIVMRLFLMARSDTFVAWCSFGYLLAGMIWFFTYFSYSENVYQGYWFNPNLHNITELDNH